MRWAIAWPVVAAVALAGCDIVLGLQRNPPDAPGPGVCIEDGPPGADDDGDSIINSQDKCPQVPDQRDAEDEDGDTVPDACDPCPQLVGAAAGDDPDCDRLGAACDPQPAAPNTRRFHGFSAQTGFELNDTIIDAGAARMELTNANPFSELIVTEPAMVPGRLETEVTIKNARVEQYWSFELDVHVGPSVYELQLEKFETSHNLRLANQMRQGLELGTMMLGPSPTTNDLTFRIRADLTDSKVTTTVIVDGVGAATLESTITIPSARIQYGFSMNRDSNPTVSITTAVVPYLAFTTLVP